MIKKLFLFLIFCLFIPILADGAILYLEPSEGEYQPEDTFIIKVKIDIGEECINTVKADLKFSQEVLEAVDFSQGDSILTLWLESPEINQSEGLISFTGGVPAGYCGEVPGSPADSNLLGRIIFKVQDTNIGQAEVKFLDTSQVLLNDGLGTVDELSAKGAAYSVLQHGSGSVRDEWQQELGQDKIPPEVFEVEVHQDTLIFEGKYFITFSTTDKQTGLSHFEVKEEERDWKQEESPYLLADQSLQSIIKVKAVDMAGNERIAEYVPEIPKKAFFWWIIVVVLISVIAIICIWRKYIKKH